MLLVPRILNEQLSQTKNYMSQLNETVFYPPSDLFMKPTRLLTILTQNSALTPAEQPLSFQNEQNLATFYLVTSYDEYTVHPFPGRSNLQLDSLRFLSHTEIESE